MKSINIDLKKISGIFKRHKHSLFHRDAFKDWLHILIGATILSLIVIAVDGYLFYKISVGEIFIETVDVIQKVDTVDRGALKKANDYYDAQQTKYSEIKASPVPVIDPSI